MLYAAPRASRVPASTPARSAVRFRRRARNESDAFRRREPHPHLPRHRATHASQRDAHRLPPGVALYRPCRRSPGPGWIARELRLDAREISAARGSQKTDDPFRDGKPTRQNLAQKLRNLLVLAILRHDQQRVLERIRAVSGIGSLFQQEANQLQMTLAHREVYRRRVVILAKGHFAAPRNQRLHLVQIALQLAWNMLQTSSSFRSTGRIIAPILLESCPPDSRSRRGARDANTQAAPRREATPTRDRNSADRARDTP